MGKRSKKRKSDAASGALVTTATVAVVAGGPLAALPALGSAALRAIVAAMTSRIDEQRYRRIERVLLVASTIAGSYPDAILAAIESESEGGRLLLDLLLAAQDEGVDRKFYVIAGCLARGAVSTDEHRVTTERLIVAAVRDLGVEHFEVLACFDKSAEELGLPQQMPAARMSSMNWDQLESVVPQFVDILHALVGGLERHGLIEVLSSGAMIGGGGRSSIRSITPLGTALLERLNEADRITSENSSAGSSSNP